MRKRRRNQYRPWFKAFAGLFINLSAAWLAVPFIGFNFSIPNELRDLITLLADVILGVLFFLLSALFERKLEK